jgi:hypothetical protein
MRLIIILLIILAFCYIAEAQLILQTSTQSNAGGVSQGGGLSLTSTFGQGSAVGSIADGQLYVSNGYIYAVMSDQMAPNIALLSVSPLSPAVDQQITVTATITDNYSVQSALLAYRKGGDVAFFTISMSKTGDSYQAVIPAAAVTSRGIEYYITASDYSSNSSRLPASGVTVIQITISGEGLAKSAAQPSGSAQNAYRLISIPVDATNKNPDAILLDDLGAYDNTKWRFYELKADQTYAEYGSTSTINPGKSFWLITKDAGKIIDSGPGKSNLTDKPFAIPLNPGWTFIGNPFNFDIPFTKVTRKSGGTMDIRYYNGSWATATTPLIPFEGYAVANTLANVDTLLVDPQIGTVTPKASLAKAANELWSINISAECQEAKDMDNKISVVSDANSGFDEMDKPEPPIIGEYVSVYFPHSEWNGVFKNYSTDARPTPVIGDTWEFELKSNIENKIQLDFSSIETVPQQFEVWLVDKLLSTTQNVKLNNKYSFTNLSSKNPRQMILVVGNSSFIHDKLTELHAIPEAFELSQNFPNPFNPATVIRYGLRSASRVTIKLYDLLGQEIKTLVDETQDKGYRSVEWNGKNEFGSTIASGIYVYRITATNTQNVNERFVQTKKMLLLK